MNWVAPIKDEDTLVQFEEKLRRQDMKYYIMFMLGISTGLMLQDILSFKVKDVLNKDKIITVIGAKKVKQEFIVPQTLKTEIADYCKNKKADDYLITAQGGKNMPISREQAYRVLKDIGKELGLLSIGAQTMRKTFAWRYYKETNDIYYLQNLFCHASPTITYRFIGEKPNVAIILRKLTAEENERSRLMLYKNNNGIKRINEIIEVLDTIKEQFKNPCNSDSYFGKVDSFLTELETIVKVYKEEK